MFRRLRLSLVMANLGAIVVIFVLLGGGTYIYVQQRLFKGTESMLSRVAEDLVSGRLKDLPPDRGLPPVKNPPPVKEPPPVKVLPDKRPGPGTFFVKIDQAGRIVLTSSYSPLSEADLVALVGQTRKAGKTSGSVVFSQIEYLYRVAPLPGSQGAFLVFQDFRPELNMLRLLVTAVGLAGLACVVLSLLVSFFMADRAMIPIKKAWQQQTEFLADASHELRTPLAIVQTNLEIVRSNPTETVQSQERWLTNIHEETVAMAKLIDSLLFLARADAHQQLLAKDRFSLGSAVAAAAEAFRPLAAAKGVTLEILPGAEVNVRGDETKLRQVVGILLDNAIRHTPSGGRVALALEPSHQGILLSVSDTGEGIGPEHLGNVFRRFYQVDPSRSHGGAGLGLAIAKWIVESHGGSITVASTVGEGTVFTIWLPKADEPKDIQRTVAS